MDRVGWRAATIAIAFSMLAAACTTDSPPGASAPPGTSGPPSSAGAASIDASVIPTTTIVLDTDPRDWVEGLRGDGGRTVGELCEVGACVADLVLLPDRVVADSTVDLPLAETLGALSVERAWAPGTTGLFGAGWISTLDIEVQDRALVGPIPSRPISQPDPGAEVRFADGSLMTFDNDGELTNHCVASAYCVDVTRSDTAIRVTTTANDNRWVEFSIVDDRITMARSSDGRSVLYAYNGGRLVSAGDTTYDYENDLLTNISQLDGNRSFTYSSNGNVSATTGRDGGTWRVDGSNDDIEVTDPDGDQRRYLFDSEQRLTSIEADSGMLLERDFVGASMVAERRPLDGLTTTMTTPGLITVEQLSELQPPSRAEYAIDTSGRIARSTVDGVVTSYTYSEVGLALSANGPSGRIDYSYDEDGLLASTIDADGYEVNLTRDADGNVVEITDGSTTTTLSHDDLGRPIAQTDGTFAQSATYGSNGQVDSTTESDGTTTRYEYNEAGALTRAQVGNRPPVAMTTGSTESTTTGPAVQVLDIEQTADGERYNYSDGSAVLFDPNGRPIETRAGGRVENRSYDDLGRLEVLDAFNGSLYRIARTPGGRIDTLDIDGVRYNATWNGDRLTGLTSGGGLKLDFDWDGAGLLTAATANNASWRYGYDAAGNVDQVNTPGGTTNFEWDNAGHPTAIVGADGATDLVEWAGDQIIAVSSDDELLALTYNIDGRIEQISDSNGVVDSYRYNSSGQIAGGSINDTELTLDYRNGQISSICQDDTCESWAYNDRLVNSVTADDGRTFAIDWASPGQIASITRGIVPVVEVTTDELGNVTRIDDGSDETDMFTWDGNQLTAATVNGDTAQVNRNQLGLITKYVDADLNYAATFSGATISNATIGTASIDFQYDGGVLEETAVSLDDDGEATIQWEDARPSAFTSTEGNGQFTYTDNRVSLIEYDDRARNVEYGDGSISAEGTGGELLADLFDDSGRFRTRGNLPVLYPSVPVLAQVPSDIGFTLPRPLTGDQIVDAALATAIPNIPSLIVGNGDASTIADGLTNSVLGRLGGIKLTTGPAGVIAVNPFQGITNDDVLSSIATISTASSVLTRLSPDPSIASQVLGGAASVFGSIGATASAIARFVVNNPVTRAVGQLLFFAASTSAVTLCFGVAAAAGTACVVGLMLVGAIPSSRSVGDLLHNAFVEPWASLATGLVDLDPIAWLTVASVVALGFQAPMFQSFLRRQPCGLRRVVCIKTGEFGQAGEHIKDATAAGYPRLLRLDRPSAAARRQDALKDFASKAGFDRDEYPPAFARAVGHPVSVRLIDPSSNRSAGAYFQHQTAGLRDGSFFYVIPI